MGIERKDKGPEVVRVWHWFGIQGVCWNAWGLKDRAWRQGWKGKLGMDPMLALEKEYVIHLRSSDQGRRRSWGIRRLTWHSACCPFCDPKFLPCWAQTGEKFLATNLPLPSPGYSSTHVPFSTMKDGFVCFSVLRQVHFTLKWTKLSSLTLQSFWCTLHVIFHHLPRKAL